MSEISELKSFIKEAQKNIVPEAVTKTPTMLMNNEISLLYALGRDYYRNEGMIIDAGCFLGGSTCAFANGVQDNPKYQAAPRSGIIHSYDLFETEQYTLGTFFPVDTPLKTSFEDKYRENIKPFADLVTVHKGNIMKDPVFPDPIEILFLDIAKIEPVCDHVTRMFFPRLIPGRSILVHQDYIWYHENGWLHPTMAYFSEYFEIIGDTNRNSTLFLYTKQIPQHLLERDLMASLRMAEIYRLSVQAASTHFDKEQRKIIGKSRDEYMDILHKTRPMSERIEYLRERYFPANLKPLANHDVRADSKKAA